MLNIRHWSNNRNGAFHHLVVKFRKLFVIYIFDVPSMMEFNGNNLTLVKHSWSTYLPDHISSYGPADNLLKFILDTSTNPTGISLGQIFGSQPLCIIFQLIRSWCFSIHKEQTRFLRSFNYNWICIRQWDSSASISKDYFNYLLQVYL